MARNFSALVISELSTAALNFATLPFRSSMRNGTSLLINSLRDSSILIMVGTIWRSITATLSIEVPNSSISSFWSPSCRCNRALYTLSPSITLSSRLKLAIILSVSDAVLSTRACDPFASAPRSTPVCVIWSILSWARTIPKIPNDNMSTTNRLR